MMMTLMEDPVTLPTKGEAVYNVERNHIAQHLLSNPVNPFDRSPLTMDQVTPNAELKARIEAWKAQKRAERS